MPLASAQTVIVGLERKEVPWPQQVVRVRRGAGQRSGRGRTLGS
jgi:hypothetical protein